MSIENDITVTVKYSFTEIVALAHDVVMSTIHRTPEKDAQSSYKAKTLARLVDVDDGLFEPLFHELSHAASDVSLQRVIDRLDEFCDTRDWPISASRHQHIVSFCNKKA